jgi:acetyltransferase-like isoleucine patch superfamily enzyme
MNSLKSVAFNSKTLIGKILTIIKLSFNKISYVYFQLVIKPAFNLAGNNTHIVQCRSILGHKYISLGQNVKMEKGVILEAYDHHNGVKFTPSIFIDDNVSINYNCQISAINCVKIGKNVLIASDVYISDHYHGDPSNIDLNSPPSSRILYSKGDITIEQNCWIGRGVAILPGVIIGENSIIGANSVVTKSIPKNSVAAGVPAKVIRNIK